MTALAAGERFAATKHMVLRCSVILGETVDRGSDMYDVGHFPAQPQAPAPYGYAYQRPDGAGIRFWRAAYPVLAFIGIQAVAGFVIGIMLAADPALYARVVGDFDLAWLLLIVAVGAQIVIVPFLIAFRVMDFNRLQAKRAWKTYRKPNFGYLALCLALGIAIAVFALCAFEFVGFGDDGTQTLLFSSGPVISVLFIGLIGPAVEELLFRVLLYGRLREWMSPISAGLLSALVFTLAHGNVIQGVTAFFYGLALALVYERFKTFWAPFLLHAGINTTVVITAVMGRTFLHGPSLPIIAVASAAVAAILLVVAYRANPPKEALSENSASSRPVHDLDAL